MSTVPEILRAGAETYEERNALYKDNYKRIGELLAILFPEGLPSATPGDWNRGMLLCQCLFKLTRYAASMSNGVGHRDSAHDLMVYAAMLEEMTEE